MAGERRQLAPIGALVEREEDEREVLLVAVEVEERLEVAHIIGAGGDVGAHVAAEAGVERGVVVAAWRRDGAA